MKSAEPKVVPTKDTVSSPVSSLPGGRNGSAAMTGDSPVREVDSRIGRVTARVPETERLCLRKKSMRGWQTQGVR